MAIDLTDKEKEVLKNFLDLALGELREEIVKTESHVWKPILHDEENTLKDIIKKLS